MVMALHLEHDRLAVTDIDDAGVLARALDHPGRLGRQPAQMQPRRLVRAVLVPHRRENPELGETRHPPISLRMRSYSSGFSPWLATSSGVICGWFMRLLVNEGFLLGTSAGVEKDFLGAISGCP